MYNYYFVATYLLALEDRYPELEVYQTNHNDCLYRRHRALTYDWCPFGISNK